MVRRTAYSRNGVIIRDRFQNPDRLATCEFPLTSAALHWTLMRLGPGITNDYLNWKQMIDHVAGVVLVMLVRLNITIGIFCAGQQRVLPRLLRRDPIKFPTSPRMPLNRIYEFCLGPGLATVSAYRYFRHFGFTCPSSAKHCVCLVRCNCFISSWSEDLGLQLHFSERAAHRLSIHLIPVP